MATATAVAAGTEEETSVAVVQDVVAAAAQDVVAVAVKDTVAAVATLGVGNARWQ